MNIRELEKELKELQEALKNNLITVNEYCSAYHEKSKKYVSMKSKLIKGK